ncbi:NUDIX hydrolase [Sutcliffiella horikoshii]|uniref:NUDIX hydrolase n=1 Tax=Sutcliffiella horikoshii TaxID=79883 RepID=UPI0007D053CF|nr:NUDIX hydrolase [Sutcliffiella horikoshii]MCM3616010.1 NUDIX hydrolase [Sutcliffiella horikoshii]
MSYKWLDWAKQMQAIAQAGLTYSKDIYDIERFEQLRELSVEMMSEQTGLDKKKIRELFANETGYQTPKVDIRAVIIKDGRILLVKEKQDEGWSLPGGWADIGFSPTEVAVKEAYEESGYHVKATKLLGVFDKKYHPHPPSPYHIYKIFIACEIIGGEARSGIETSNVAFFHKDELPNLSIDRNTESQIMQMFAHYEKPSKEVQID